MDNNSFSLGAGKVKNAKVTFKQFLASIKKYRFSIIISIILAIASAVTGLFTPKILGDMTTIAFDTYPNIDYVIIGQKAVLVIVLFLISALLNYAQAFILGVVSARYTRDMREMIIDKISKLPISYFDRHKFGDTLSRMTNDVDVLTTSMSQEIADISLSLTTLIGVMIIMLIISVPLSLISFIIVPLSVVVVGKIAKFAHKYFREHQAMLGVLNSKIEEDYAGQSIIKSNSYEPIALEDFDDTNEKLAKASLRSQFYSSLSMPVTHIFTNLSYVAVCLAASERIFEFLNEPEEEPDISPAQKIEKIKGEVEFHDINFSYLKDTPVIKGFSVKVEPGMKVAIVGPTGAGKTTIINLLMRFYEPDSGYISIDGVPTREMERADVRGLFGMVLQDTWLFSGTVEENLRYGRQDATLEEIKAAAKASNIHHVIESLPKGYKTMISEDSDNISAGEKQLITIARAMVANPPMMILDEATSNVDTRTEQLIQDSFEKLTKGRTSFVIAHRLSTIRNSDLILVMRDGNIVEHGNHEELLKQNGFYAELYNSQFADN